MIEAKCRFCGEEVETDLIGGDIQAFLVGTGPDTAMIFQHTKCAEEAGEEVP